MSEYNSSFYDDYDSYLHEPSVRKAHDWVFSLLSPEFKDTVIDFGCGRAKEFNVWVRPTSYLGMDNFSESNPTVQHNYRSEDLWDVIGSIWRPWFTAFVSLFSAELTASQEENYAFYEEVFQRFSSITSGLVSGMYYGNRRFETQVQEVHGLKSYQTLGDVAPHPTFTEKRIILPVPSKMFGEDVFEVWKILGRKW